MARKHLFLLYFYFTTYEDQSMMNNDSNKLIPFSE